MTGGAHEKQHGERQPEIQARTQQRDSRRLGRLGRHRCSLAGVGFGPADHFLLHAPHHAPNVQQHEPAQSAANADRQGAIALPAMLIQAQKNVRRRDQRDPDNDSQHGALPQPPGRGHQRSHTDDEGQRPEAEEGAEHHSSGRRLARRHRIANVAGHNVHPVGHAGQERHHCAPAKPPQGPPVLRRPGSSGASSPGGEPSSASPSTSGGNSTSSTGGSSTASSNAPPKSDDDSDRPTLKASPSASSSSPSDSKPTLGDNTQQAKAPSAASNAPPASSPNEDDPNRPVLRRGKQAEQPAV